MSIHNLGTVRPGKTIYLPFHTFDSNDPQASATITGLALADILVYKDGSTTERASTAGFTLLDTDGIDFDAKTGIHGISIDLSDNTTAGFYAAGSSYFVVIDTVTLDGASVRFVLATFDIGHPEAHINTTIATLSTQTSFTLSDGPAEDDALNGMWALVHDVASANQMTKVLILDYVGASKTVTLAAAGTFTIAATDNFSIMGLAPLQANTIGEVLNISSGIAQSNVKQISDDSTAADNLELQYDGTGISGDNYPATQAQLGNIASGSASISTVAESYTLTTGTQSSGLYTDTETEDGTDHQHTDSAGALELYYQFDVGGNGIASEVNFFGYLTGANDTVGIYAYDWVGASWDQIGNWVGSNSATDEYHTHNLLTRHTGTGANLGKVRIRFYAASGLTTATLSIDQISVAYAVVAQSVGYAMGAVWVDTVGGVAGTESYVNGVADNPVLTWADALTIASNVGLKIFRVSPDSSITLAASFQNQVIKGDDTTLALGGQDCAGSHFHDMNVTGTATGASEINFHSCHIGAVTVAPSHFYDCSFSGTLTFGSAGDFIIVNCYSEVAGAGSPTIDFGAAVGATNLNLRNWSGGITLNNLASGDVVTLDGVFGTITLNGADATVEIRGIAKAVVNNLTGSPTVNDDSVKRDEIETIDANVDLILADTGELQTDWTDGGRLDLLIDAIKALLDDARGEPGQGAPPVNPDLATKIDYLYKAWRNKSTSSSSQYSLYNDAGTVIDQKATTSDSAGTFTRDEIVTGP